MNDFPSLPERDLPAGRHQLLKEHLLNEIQQAAARPEPAPVRKKWLRPAFAGPVLAGALALAVVGGVALMGGDDGGAKGGTEAGGPQPQGAPQTAAQLLDRVATVASQQDALEIRDDQYAYVKTKAAYGESMICDALKLGPVKTREAWISVDGGRSGVIRTDGGPAETTGVPTPGIASNTYYRHLESLPTDPAKMLDWLHKASEGGKSEDQNTFVLVGDLVRESLVPPKVAAALYRAAAKIPGVELVPNATDAIGRKGIAVGRVDEQGGGRNEWIFDAKTYEYLGERGVLTRDSEGGTATDKNGKEMKCATTPAGTVTANTAVLERSVVDSAPEAHAPGADKDHPVKEDAGEFAGE